MRSDESARRWTAQPHRSEIDESSQPPAGSEMGRRVFVDAIGVIGAGKKCEPANSMSQAVHAGSWQAVMELPDIS